MWSASPAASPIRDGITSSSSSTRVRRSASLWKVMRPAQSDAPDDCHAKLSSSRSSRISASQSLSIFTPLRRPTSMPSPSRSMSSTQCMPSGSDSSVIHSSHATSTGTAMSIDSWIGRRRTREASGVAPRSRTEPTSSPAVSRMALSARDPSFFATRPATFVAAPRLIAVAIGKLPYERALPTFSARSRASFTSLARRPNWLAALPMFLARPSRPPPPVPGSFSPRTFFGALPFRPRMTPPTTPAAAPTTAVTPAMPPPPPPPLSPPPPLVGRDWAELLDADAFEAEPAAFEAERFDAEPLLRALLPLLDELLRLRALAWLPLPEERLLLLRLLLFLLDP